MKPAAIMKWNPKYWLSEVIDTATMTRNTAGGPEETQIIDRDSQV
jgi:hypothetical protein